jgi:hypothetical protein
MSKSTWLLAFNTGTNVLLWQNNENGFRSYCLFDITVDCRLLQITIQLFAVMRTRYLFSLVAIVTVENHRMILYVLLVGFTYNGAILFTECRYSLLSSTVQCYLLRSWTLPGGEQVVSFRIRTPEGVDLLLHLASAPERVREVLGTPEGAREVLGASEGVREDLGTPEGVREILGTLVEVRVVPGTPEGVREVLETPEGAREVHILDRVLAGSDLAIVFLFWTFEVFWVHEWGSREVDVLSWASKGGQEVPLLVHTSSASLIHEGLLHREMKKVR